MQIHEITKLNENALGAFGAGFAQGAGLNVPSGGSDDKSNYVSGYGPGRQQAAANAAKPLIAAMAKKEMDSWNDAVVELLAKNNVQSPAQLDAATKTALKRDLFNRVHQVFMQRQLGSNYVQELPASVNTQAQSAAKDLVNRLNLATQAINNFDKPAVNAAEQLKQWVDLSQSAYEAMTLAQFYPAQGRGAAGAAPVTGPMPELLANPNGTYNLGPGPKFELTSSPADSVITQKIQAELKANPSNRMPELKSNSDGSINIGSQRLDPRNPDEAGAIQRILSAVAKPAASANAPTGAPASFNAANVMRTFKPTAVAAESKRQHPTT
jgi:hypothetical protein